MFLVLAALPQILWINYELGLELPLEIIQLMIKELMMILIDWCTPTKTFLIKSLQFIIC